VTSPINILLDRVDWRCTRCNAPKSVKCSCWEQVKLHCPGCGRTKKATREPSDPIGAKIIELRCPECWEKD
jgi:hypothetical protein